MCVTQLTMHWLNEGMETIFAIENSYNQKSCYSILQHHFEIAELLLI